MGKYQRMVARRAADEKVARRMAARKKARRRGLGR